MQATARWATRDWPAVGRGRYADALASVLVLVSEPVREQRNQWSEIDECWTGLGALALSCFVIWCSWLFFDECRPVPIALRSGVERHRGFLREVRFRRGPLRTPRFCGAQRRAMGTDDMKREAKKGREWPQCGFPCFCFHEAQPSGTGGRCAMGGVGVRGCARALDWLMVESGWLIGVLREAHSQLHPLSTLNHSQRSEADGVKDAGETGARTAPPDARAGLAVSVTGEDARLNTRPCYVS